MKILTVNELHKLCEDLIANDNGDKKIMIHCNLQGDDFYKKVYHLLNHFNIKIDIFKNKFIYISS